MSSPLRALRRSRADAPSPGRRRRLGTATRLMIGYALVLFLVIGGIAYQSNRLLDRRMQRALDNDLEEQVVEYVAGARRRPAGQSLETFTVNYLRLHFRPRGLALIVQLAPTAPPGPRRTPGVFATPGTEALLAAPRIARWLRQPPATTRLADVTVRGVSLRAAASPIVMGGRRRGMLIAADDIDPLKRDRRSQLIFIAAEGAVALLAAIVGGYLLLRRILRVVARVADTAEEITVSGDLSRRLQFEGPDDEVGRLSRTVDSMLDRLETVFRDRSQLLADVSHQLRTPLTIVRGHLDVLSRGGFDDPKEVSETVALVIDELDQLALMVERMLLLGQALERGFLIEETVELRDLLADVLDASHFLGERTWVLGPAPPVAVRVDRAKLRGALLNLLDNAVKATRDGDRISIGASLEHGGVALEVRDSGPGLTPEQWSAAQRRFARGGTPRYRGSGLGLAIVSAVAEAHGGRLELSSTPGHGSTVRIILPADRLVPGSRRPEAH